MIDVILQKTRKITGAGTLGNGVITGHDGISKFDMIWVDAAIDQPKPDSGPAQARIVGGKNVDGG